MANLERAASPPDPEELELHAYNAAFYALGLRWHWDRATYAALLKDRSAPAERIHHYLLQHQSHLLRAYDAEFLAAAIEEKKASCLESIRTLGPGACTFDWSESRGGELGA